jgi:hypothetical protein
MIYTYHYLPSKVDQLDAEHEPYEPQCVPPQRVVVEEGCVVVLLRRNVSDLFLIRLILY